MSYSISYTDSFNRNIKALAKKYKSIKEDLSQLAEQLRANPNQGTEVYKNCYKIRLAIKSKGRGKSGGARVITYVKVVDETVYLLTVYDKSDQDTIHENELKYLLQSVNTP